MASTEMTGPPLRPLDDQSQLTWASVPSEISLSSASRADVYSVDGLPLSGLDERLVLDMVEGEWAVHYAERGGRSGELRFDTSMKRATSCSIGSWPMGATVCPA